MFYNFCRVHDFLRCTPAVAAGVSDHFWSIEELIDRALGTQPIAPEPTAPQLRKR